jgi:amidohydrolase
MVVSSSSTPVPSRPYGEFAEELRRRLDDAMRTASPPASPHAGAPGDVLAALESAVATDASDLVSLSHDVFEHPELCFEERQAVDAVCRLLSSRGIDVTRGAFGLDTALRATVGSGNPRVVVVAEYDALPEIGHACGHNVICASFVGAFLALAAVASDLGGTVELYGTPAEEGGGGKELIRRAGGFHGVDVAAMAHPAGMDVVDLAMPGIRQVAVTYHGLTAHASAVPWSGRNALDAVVAAYEGIARMRQHVLPGDRLHGVITDGGQKPNIVPDRAAALFYVRSLELRTLEELCERVDAVLRAAAAMTGVGVDVDWDVAPTYLPVRNNEALGARFARHVQARGRSPIPGPALPTEFSGSTDMGNVSRQVPSIHPLIAVSPPDVSPHTPEFAGWARGAEGDRAVVDAAFGLAATLADYLVDPDLRSAVREEFTATGAVSAQLTNQPPNSSASGSNQTTA